MTTRTTFIYALEDPQSHCVRYVGKAVNPLERLKRHLTETGNKAKLQWLEELMRLCQLPRIVILEEVSVEDWKDRERFWVSHFSKQGCNLFNRYLLHTDAVPITLRLSPLGLSLWEKLACRRDTDMNAWLEMTLRRLGEEEGLDITPDEARS